MPGTGFVHRLAVREADRPGHVGADHVHHVGGGRHDLGRFLGLAVRLVRGVQEDLGPAQHQHARGLGDEDLAAGQHADPAELGVGDREQPVQAVPVEVGIEQVVR